MRQVVSTNCNYNLCVGLQRWNKWIKVTNNSTPARKGWHSVHTNIINYGVPNQSCVRRKLINKISVQDFWRPSIAGSSLEVLFELLLRLCTDIIGIRLSHTFRIHALIWKNKEWVLTYILSKPPRLELFNDITFIYGHKAPPHPATDLSFSRPFHHSFHPSLLSSLLSFTPFLHSIPSLLYGYHFYTEFGSSTLYFILAGPFETFCLVSHSKLYMLTPGKWEAVSEPLSAVTWREGTCISMSRDRTEVVNESFTSSSGLAAIIMK